MRTVRSYLSIAAAGLLALSAGCASTSRLSPPSDAGTTVIVRNNNFSDMNVYIISTGGARTRVGFAPGEATTSFVLPASAGSVRIVADPVGGTVVARSGELSVNPGDTIDFTIEQNVALSMATVRGSEDAR